ncbi:Hypothetical_protein [Hexamita inflata]|uniref:Hypothetical_protein n=1 Tax=Hexamita inflata TaxID=28002 RepID=A0AA86PLY7_9EUKA|nr:Hypothetical protein HINF_LOCUS28317 [Hexamita inflata]CAI9952001.1 Hypothetical protein HINF_LOCUS39646 [Hexamita inflata]
MKLEKFLCNKQTQETEINFSQLLFTNEVFMIEMLKKYTLIQCSHAKQIHCLLRQVNSHVIEMKKNQLCTRRVGIRRIIVKTYIKFNTDYMDYKYLVRPDKTLVSFNVDTARKMDSWLNLSSIVFRGAHNFDAENPCDQQIVKVHQFNSYERQKLNECIVYHVNNNQELKEFTFDW